MGMVWSFLTSSSSSQQQRLASSSTTTTTTTQLSKYERVAAWKQAVRDFEAQVLHPDYLPHPVRSSTIQAARDYPQSLPSLEADHAAATLLPGAHKHLGGAYDPTDGCIYGVPAHAKHVLVLYPKLIKVKVVKEECQKDAMIAAPRDDITYGMTSIPLPAHVAGTKFKWLRGIFANGYLYAIPAWANAVLCVDVDAYWGRRRRSAKKNGHGDDDIVTLIPLPPEYAAQQPPHTNQSGSANPPPPVPNTWQWHGAGMNHEQTALYCIPSNARHVLKVDLITHTCSLLPIEADPVRYPEYAQAASSSSSSSTTITNKWYGGIVGRDNCVYGVPYRACAVLRIDCRTDRAELIGTNYGLAAYNWHGGICVQGKIYCHPSHSVNRTVLVINTNHHNVQQNDSSDNNPGYCYELPITPWYKDDETNLDEHKTGAVEQNVTTTTTTTRAQKAASSSYQWLGGCVGADGNIYCPACDTTAVLQINVQTEQCRTFGFTGTDKNKWQGGVLSRHDGAIYCIPASGRHVLRIDTNMNNNNNNTNKNTLTTTENGAPPPPSLQLLGHLPAHKDKWQGGHVGLDGNLYFIPENGYRVLRIRIPQNNSLKKKSGGEGEGEDGAQQQEGAAILEMM